MASYILGINAYHGNSSACLLRDGRLVAAAEEERFRRIKHWAGFPSLAISYCLAEAGIALADVEHVAVNRDPRAQRLRKVAFLLRHRVSTSFLRDRLTNARKWRSIEEELERSFRGSKFGGKVHQIEHHLAHLASAFHVSPYREAAAVSVDGSGDFTTTAWGFGAGTELTVDHRIFFPHSLGVFYEAVTQHLGFPHYGDEYKVMGLAPYGEPRFMDKMRDLIDLRSDGTFRLNLACFRHHTGGSNYQWADEAPTRDEIFTPAAAVVLGPARQPNEPLEQRHKDIARSLQETYEAAFFRILERAHRDHPSAHLVLAGGCAYNSVANGKIHLRSPFAKCYIQSAAGDAGGAIGAAYAVWSRLHPGRRDFVMEHAYWGPGFGDEEIAKVLDAVRADIAALGCTLARVGDEGELVRRAARAIAAGCVVGWFDGRMEWGPRALGNRSILCDPRRADMKDILNHKIKRRESFRPFAPAILRDAVPEWFESDGDVPFMMKVFQIRPERRAQIPAVTHVDGSGRLQTVTQQANPRYFRLIQEFGRLTGVPILLNTSFNENEPVVCEPREALACFLRTRMDMLVIGNYVLERAAAEPAAREGRAVAAGD